MNELYVRPAAKPALSRTGLVFVWSVAVAGLGVVAYSAAVLWRISVPGEALLFAALTVASGALSLKIPSIESRFSVSAVFAITSVLLFGPEVGTIVLAVDGLRISIRWRMNRTQTIFNIANLALSMWISSRLFFAVSGLAPLYGQVPPSATVVVYLAMMTGVYFGLNTWLTAGAVALAARRSVRATWVEHYRPLFPSYLAGASVALLLVLAFREVHFTAVALIVPLLVVCYLTLQMSFARLEDGRRHVDQLNRLLVSTVETLATAIDAKDEVTHDHVRRVQRGAMEMARVLGISDPSELQAIEAAALLHDTGKIAVPEHILNKPGRLTPAEFEKMKRHSAIGAEILSSIDFPYPVLPIVRHHHENWDGTGYPDGLKGEAIPLGARILAVIDCFDALMSDRPYRRRMTVAQAIAIVHERRGSMYDPKVVDAFLADYARIMPAPEAPHPASKAIGGARTLDREERLTEGPLAVDARMADGLLAVTSLSRALTGEARVADIGALLWAILRQVLPCEAMAIFVPDAVTDTVAARYATGAYAPRLRNIARSTGAGVAGWVAVTRRAAVNADPSLDFMPDPREGTPPLRSCLAIPIGASAELTAVLVLYRTEAHAFTDDHVRLLELLAARVAAPLSLAIASDDEQEALQPAAPLALVRRSERVQG